MDKKSPPVRKIRSEYGTRVARSIVCRSCGKKDTIHFAPKDPAGALCRRCAADLLGVADHDAGIYRERNLTCITCGAVEKTHYEDDATFECRDCRAGIHTKQGDKAKGAERVSKKVIRRKG